MTNVTRNHKIQKEYSDIKLLAVHNQSCSVLPTRLGGFFVNIEGLEVMNSGLKEIGKENLMDFPRLEYLNLMKNYLECLPKNLFEGNLWLKTVVVCCNNLKTIHPTIFHLPRLNHVNFRRNICISKQADGNDEISKMNREVSRKCPPSIEVYCTFGDYEFADGSYYTCSVRFWIVVIDYMTVSNFEGRHDGRKNCHVQGLVVDEMTTKFFPTNLAYHFPKLTAIEVIGGKMSRLERRDLKPFPHLKVLWLPRNNIETLSSDVFEGNLKLEKISFYENKLKFIGSGILQPLQHLKYINLELNECIGSFSSAQNCIKNIEREIHEYCQ